MAKAKKKAPKRKAPSKRRAPYPVLPGTDAILVVGGGQILIRNHGAQVVYIRASNRSK